VSTVKLRNIGPKSAAWLRQVGLRSREDLVYALEGALLDCHWQEVPEARRTELVQAAEAAIALLPPPRNRPAASPVTTTQIADNHMDAAPAFELLDEPGSDAE
jgi:DNA transformation protein